MKTSLKLARCALWCVLLIMGISCETEPIDEPLKDGYMSYSGKFADLSAFKAVPECSEFTPNEVYVKMIRPIDGSTHSATAPITIVGDEIFTEDPLIFQEGKYLKQEVSLRYNGIVTHSAPSELDPRQNFAVYVQYPLPQEVEIIAGQITPARDEVMCYTEEIIELPSSLEWVGSVKELETMWFYIPPGENCIQSIILAVDNYGHLFRLTQTAGLYSIAIPTDLIVYTLYGMQHDQIVQEFTGTNYNPDGILDQDDILFFDPCDGDSNF